MSYLSSHETLHIDAARFVENSGEEPISRKGGCLRVWMRLARGWSLLPPGGTSHYTCYVKPNITTGVSGPPEGRIWKITGLGWLAVAGSECQPEAGAKLARARIP